MVSAYLSYPQDHHIVFSTLLSRFHNVSLALQHRSLLMHSALSIDCKANLLSAQFFLQIIASSVRVSGFQKRCTESPRNFQWTHADVPPKAPPSPVCRENRQTRKAHDSSATGDPTTVRGVDWNEAGSRNGAVLRQRALYQSQIRGQDVRLLGRKIPGGGRWPTVVQTCRANGVWRHAGYRMGCAKGELVRHQDHVCHRIVPCDIDAFYGAGVGRFEVLTGYGAGGVQGIPAADWTTKRCQPWDQHTPRKMFPPTECSRSCCIVS
jgi:hypothetical protein